MSGRKAEQRVAVSIDQPGISLFSHATRLSRDRSLLPLYASFSLAKSALRHRFVVVVEKNNRFSAAGYLKNKCVFDSAMRRDSASLI